jgi:N6-adenosine-specific RNA methylase IME4
VNLPDKKYSLIYADPPWKYGFWYKSEIVKRNAADHYSVMDLNSLSNLDVKGISERDSVLLMWVTYPCLLEGMCLIDSWGFVYKTVAFTWIKRNKKSDSWFFGLGNYTRANAEICLLATRGKGLKRLSRSVRQIIDTPIEEHSKKPDEARDRIVQLFGDVPRIELFARERYDGWDSWGNEI